MRLEPSAFAPEAALELEQLASAPYNTFVYETADDARTISMALLDAGAGEVAASLVAVDDDGVAVGVLTCLTADELRTARTAAAMALVRGRLIDPRGPVRERMLLAADTLLDVAPGDFYLSRIAVVPAARRRGVAAWLMAEYERLGRARGCSRLVLEVSPAHAPAVALYERHGFTQINEVSITDPASARTLAYRHMTKALT